MKKFTQELYDQAIVAAMVYGDPEMTQWIRERQENIEKTIHLNTGEGSTLLRIAASRGYVGLAKILLDALSQDDEKYVVRHALHFAISYGKLDVANLFIYHGVDINAKNYYGETSVAVAIKRKNYEALRFLAEKGANLETLSNYHTPLMCAVMNEDHKAISILLSLGVETNATYERSGETALHIAAQKGDVMAVKLLLDAGADVNLKNKQGQSAISSAIYQPEVVNLFLSRGLVSHKDRIEAISMANNPCNEPGF